MTPLRTFSARGSRRIGLGAVLGLLALAAAACGSAAAGSRTGTSGSTVRVGQTAMGPVLVDSAGRTLYAFSADSPSTIVCGSGCTSVWPPLTVAAGSTPSAGPGVTGRLGTVTRPDGAHQVTYNGLLLYSFTGDSGAGQTHGQGVVEQYGATKGTWSAVTPSSSASAASPTTTAPGPTTTAPKPAAPASPAPSTTAPAPATTAPAPTTTAPAPTTTVPPTTTTTSGGAWA